MFMNNMFMIFLCGCGLGLNFRNNWPVASKDVVKIRSTILRFKSS